MHGLASTEGMGDNFFQADKAAAAASERQRLWRRILGSLTLPGVPSASRLSA